MESDDLFLQAAYCAIAQIAACESEEAVARITKKAVLALGATSYVYSTLSFSDRSDGRDSYRYFIGCDPEWCRIYNERRWFMNDPFVEYARYNTEPVLGSQILPKTAGQVEMLRVAASYGFRSGMLIPTHSSHPVSERMGLLYIGLDDEPAAAEVLLKRNRVLYRSLGMELLDWWTRCLRREAARKYNLSEEEIALLQLTKNGCVVAEMSAKLDISPSRMYRRLGIIKDKLNVEKIADAVVIANAAGLLG